MKTMKQFLAMLLAAALLCAGLLPASAADDEDFDYRIVNGGAVVTHFGSADTDVVVPQRLGGYPVVGLDVDAFQGNDTLERITLPDTMAALEAEQFSSCTALREVQFGNGLRSIGISAFWNCRSLARITIPDSVTSIGAGAFTDCVSLQEVTFGSGIETLPTSIFDMCASLKTVVLGANVASVAPGAFSGAFTKGGDLYLLSDKTELPTQGMDDFAATIHCFEDSSAAKTAQAVAWNTVFYSQSALETAVQTPISVTASPQPQAVPTDGLHVYAVFSDSTDAFVHPKKEVTDYAVPASMVFDTPGTVQVTVSYAGFTAVYPVTVLDPVTEKGIEIVRAPSNTLYYASAQPQTVSTDGLRVDLVMSDGTREDVTARCTVSGAALLNTPGTAEISVSFGAYTASFPVTVRQSALTLTTGGKAVSGAVLKKIGLFSAYRRNPVTFSFSGIDESMIAKTEWSIAEGGSMRVENGKVTYSNFFAGTGVVRLSITDIHGVRHTAEARVIFYRLGIQLPLRFNRYL